MGWKAPCTDGLDNPKVFMGWKAPATDGLDSPNFLMGWIAPATGLDSPNYFMGWKAPATGLDSPIFHGLDSPMSKFYKTHIIFMILVVLNVKINLGTWRFFFLTVLAGPQKGKSGQDMPDYWGWL